MKHLNVKTVLLAVLTILLAACDDLSDIGVGPQILSFTANPSIIEAGKSSALKWNIIGGADDIAVTLTPGDVELERSGAYEVTPSETTTYTLSVRDQDRVTTKELTVTVNTGGANPENPENPEPENPEPENPETPEQPEDKVVEGDVMITNQADLDALEGVTHLTGNLSIKTQVASLDFSPLSVLQSVSDNIIILDNPNLQTVEGFPSLIKIGDEGTADIVGRLTISLNPKLTTLNGFNALKNMGSLDISSNGALVSFSGFEALELAGINISDNNALVTLPDFAALVKAQSYDHGLTFSDNAKLSALPKFERLKSVASFDISNNDALSVVEGFESLDYVSLGFGGNDEQAIIVRENANLTEISGFENATGLDGLIVFNNPKLKLISGFSKVLSIGIGRPAFNILDNPELEEIAGFDVLEEVNPQFELSNLPKLTKIPSFDTLKINNGFENFLITGTGLEAVTGFNSLNITNRIIVSENPVLSEISGFSSQEDGSMVTVSNNDVFDCSVAPQANLPFLPIGQSRGNAVDCPTD